MDVIGTAEDCCICIPRCAFVAYFVGPVATSGQKPPATMRKPPRTFLVGCIEKGQPPPPNGG